MLLLTPGLGQYISGAILFDETLYQKTKGGKQFVDVLMDQVCVKLAEWLSRAHSENIAGFLALAWAFAA